MDMEEIRACAGCGIGGTLILNDGRRIEVKHIDHVGETFLFFSPQGALHAQVLDCDQLCAWQMTVVGSPP